MRLLLGLLAVLLAAAAHAVGKPPDEHRTTFDPAIMKIDEGRYLGQNVGAGAGLVDEQGRPFVLADVLGKPVILVLSYFGCDGSCPTLNRNLAEQLAKVQRFRSGRDYRVLSVSFDRADTTQTAQKFLQSLPQSAPDVFDGWRFAVLRDAASVEESTRKFAAAVGFQFFWSRADKMFLHPNVLVFLTPEGRVARYIYGTRLDARTLELALIDADWGRISESASAVFDMFTGACFSYNYSEGRYQPNYALLAGLGAFAFGVGLMGAGALAYRSKLARARRTAHAL